MVDRRLLFLDGGGGASITGHSRPFRLSDLEFLMPGDRSYQMDWLCILSSSRKSTPDSDSP